MDDFYSKEMSQTLKVSNISLIIFSECKDK